MSHTKKLRLHTFFYRRCFVWCDKGILCEFDNEVPNVLRKWFKNLTRWGKIKKKLRCYRRYERDLRRILCIVKFWYFSLTVNRLLSHRDNGNPWFCVTKLKLISKFSCPKPLLLSLSSLVNGINLHLHIKPDNRKNHISGPWNVARQLPCKSPNNLCVAIK